jgi:Na+/phosphate symporter
VRNRAAPEVRVRKTAQKLSGAHVQVLHEKVEMVEGRLVHMCIYQYLCVIKNALNTMC